MPDEWGAQAAALEKRIRRRVTSRKWNYFVSTSPGLESICRDEWASISLFPKTPEIFWGGFEFSGPLDSVYQSNLKLRTANRILMRIGAFKATNFRGLKKKIAGFPWELFIRQDCEPIIKVSSTRSRLYHTDAVKDRIAKVLRDHRKPDMGSQKSDRSSPQTIYVRIFEDHLTLSLDSSGENLYKRGLKTHGGKAPLRETMASAALMLLEYNGREPLIDPMCGAGTFSLEAAMTAENIPAGWWRRFAFFDWPSFSPGKWRFIRKEARKKFRSVKVPLIFASDMDTKVCKELKRCVEETGFEKVVSVKEGVDFFSMMPNSVAKKRGAVVLNPPYGLRMDSGWDDSLRFYREIFHKLTIDYKGWKAALAVPESRLANLAPFPMNGVRVFHGGVNLQILYGRIPL